MLSYLILSQKYQKVNPNCKLRVYPAFYLTNASVTYRLFKVERIYYEKKITLNWIVKSNEKYRQTTLAEYNRENIRTDKHVRT